MYTPQSGNRVVTISLNGEDNTWLDPQSLRIFFNVQNKDANLNRKFRPLSPAYSVFRRIRIFAGSQVVEDFDSYSRIHHMFSKMMSQGARKDEVNKSFGYRYDDEVKSLNNEIGTRLDYDVHSTTCPGFRDEMTVGFKPLAGLFSQFKHETDTGIGENLRNKFTVDVALPAGNASNTSTQFELNNVFCACDVSTLSNELNNEYVKRLLEGKGLPITYTTYVTQSQSIKTATDHISVFRSVSKLVASFITFYKSGNPSLDYEYADKELGRFYHPHQAHNEQEHGIYEMNKDLEFQIQLDSQLFPEYPCNSITQSFYY